MMKISLEWLLIESSKLQDHRQQSCMIRNSTVDRQLYSGAVLQWQPRADTHDIHLIHWKQALWLVGCHRLAGKGRSVAPRWPQLTARIQRFTGGRLLSFRIWSTHLLRGRPGRRCQWLLGCRPRDRLTWQLSALWAGTSSGSLATWPKRALWLLTHCVLTTTKPLTFTWMEKWVE